MLVFRLLIAIVLIALFLPIGRDPVGGTGEIGALSALGAAGAAVDDVRGFCDRQPQACAVGGRALQAMGDQARTGAATIQALIAEHSDGDAALAPAAEIGESPDAETTPPEGKTDSFSLTNMLTRLANGNVAMPSPEATAQPAQAVRSDTLMPTDMQPAWQQPNVKPGRG